MYHACVKKRVHNGGLVGQIVWAPISPTGGTPYQFETEQEALEFLDKWYPHSDPSLFRVKRAA